MVPARIAGHSFHCPAKLVRNLGYRLVHTEPRGRCIWNEVSTPDCDTFVFGAHPGKTVTNVSTSFKWERCASPFISPYESAEYSKRFKDQTPFRSTPITSFRCTVSSNKIPHGFRYIITAPLRRTKHAFERVFMTEGQDRQ